MVCGFMNREHTLALNICGVLGKISRNIVVSLSINWAGCLQH